MIPVILAILLLPWATSAAPLDEDFGYVDVRPGAHMFWVTYHVDQPGDWRDYPLIMWLQGGPGTSGVGYGNFEELGPYTVDGELRPYAWTKLANVMFVDSPVGTGYSYVDSADKYTTDNQQIAEDLVALLKSVFRQHPDISAMPFYVFSESYGGKMAADFALHLHKAIVKKEIECDFRGVALGDSWISPMDSVNTWGPYLYYLGILNREGLRSIEEFAEATQRAVDAGEWEEATELWGKTELAIDAATGGVSFYNVLAPEDNYLRVQPHAQDLSMLTEGRRVLYKNHLLKLPGDRQSLTHLMNTKMADRWDIPAQVRWEVSSIPVFNTLAVDFMKPNIESVAELLNTTLLSVDVLTGSLDLVCDTAGTYRWIEKMNWDGKESFEKIKRDIFFVSSYSEKAGYIQSSGRLAVYTFLRSGHMIPADAPEAATKAVQMIMNKKSVEKN